VVTAVDMGRALLGAVTLLRGVELAVSARNVRRLRARGAVEHGRGHYPAMVALHAGLLAGCALEPWLLPAPWPWTVALPAAAVVILAGALRWWVIATLRERWSTRVLVLPGAAPVRGGPYRWLRHPNYLAVVAEVLALPLACGAWRTALAGTIGNAVILAVRIRAEERALGPGWQEAFAAVPRLVPRGSSGAGSGAGAGAGRSTR
jgi:methyltransferase